MTNNSRLQQGDDAGALERESYVGLPLVKINFILMAVAAAVS